MDPKNRRGGTSHYTDAMGTSGGSSTQQTLPPKETSFVINNVGDITVRVHEHDIFHAESPVTNIQNFTINRHILIAASPVFKAMLTNTFFVESGFSTLDLHEDTGVTCQAMAAVLRGLDLDHQSSFWTPEGELLRQRPQGGTVYRIMPLHLLELMWHTCRYIEDDCDSDDETEIPCDNHMSANKLRWWLNYYSEKTGDMVRTIKPYQQLTIRTNQVASVSRRMMRLFWGKTTRGKPTRDIENLQFNFKGIANLEEELLSPKGSSGELGELDNKAPADGLRHPRVQNTKTSNEDLVLTTRLQLIEYACGYTRRHRIKNDNAKAVENIKEALAQTYDGGAGRHPMPDTYFMLQFDQIKDLLHEAISRDIYLTAWGVTGHLWTDGYYYQGSQPLPVERDTPDYDWAYEISIKELPYVLIALDKYKISPYALSAWFGIWYGRKNPEIADGEAALSDMMTLLLGTYKFDNADGFMDVTTTLNETGSIYAKYRWRPLLPQLLRKFPGLKRVITPDSRIIRCLNRNTKADRGFYYPGICLGCFNFSLYPWDGTSKVSDHLVIWAQKNFETIARNAVSCYDTCSCRIEHGADRLVARKSWADEKLVLERQEYDKIIDNEAEKRSWEVMKHC